LKNVPTSSIVKIGYCIPSSADIVIMENGKGTAAM
jgi:hypothetical protein